MISVLNDDMGFPNGTGRDACVLDELAFFLVHKSAMTAETWRGKEGKLMEARVSVLDVLV